MMPVQDNTQRAYVFGCDAADCEEQVTVEEPVVPRDWWQIVPPSSPALMYHSADCMLASAQISVDTHEERLARSTPPDPED